MRACVCVCARVQLGLSLVPRFITLPMALPIAEILQVSHTHFCLHMNRFCLHITDNLPVESFNNLSLSIMMIRLASLGLEMQLRCYVGTVGS